MVVRSLRLVRRLGRSGRPWRMPEAAPETTPAVRDSSRHRRLAEAATTISGVPLQGAPARPHIAEFEGAERVSAVAGAAAAETRRVRLNTPEGNRLR